MKNRIDFHSHILPGADHGSSSVDTSVKQVALLQSAEIGTIIATPHFYPEQTSIESFLAMRAFCAEQLKAYLPQNSPKIHLGAEVLICPGMEKLDGLRKLCIEGTNTLLLEMPFAHFSDKLLETVENLSKLPINIVLAHIDRYPVEEIREVMCFPVLAQINAGSLIKRKSRKELEQFFFSDRIVAFGTDLHGTDEQTVKNYVKGLSKIGEFNENAINDVTKQLIAGAKEL